MDIEIRPAVEADGAKIKSLRVTHVFGRDDGVWKLVHRHADPLIDKTAPATVLRK